MAEGPFQIVFRGETTGAYPVATVKEQLAALFRMPGERVEALFSGKPVVVKKNVDEATARRLEQAFARAGAVCEVHDPGAADMPPSTAGAEPARSTRDATGTGETASAAGGHGGEAESPREAAGPSGAILAAGDPNRTVVNLAVPDSYGGLAIDDSDAPLAAPRAHEPPAIDTSGLSLADADAGPLSERRPAPPPEIDTSGLSMERLDGDA